MTARTPSRKLLHAAWAALVAAGGLGLVLQSGASGSAAPQDGEKINHYVGAAKCKGCHRSEETGNQYAKWESMKHASAFEVLASDQAKEFGKQKGIADPQQAPECLKCHVTAYGLPEDHIKKGFDPKAGVQCESCHGPGEEHMKARMIAVAQGAKPGEYVAIPAGEIVAAPTEETCLGCHNEESPTYQPFCFHDRAAKIRHLNPKKPRDSDAKLVCGCSAKTGCKHVCDAECGGTKGK